MQRTISLKIDLPTEFSDYLETCATIFNRYVSWVTIQYKRDQLQ